jgi:hypothetical protein
MSPQPRQEGAPRTIEARLKHHLKERAQEREAKDAAREAYERRIREPWPIVKKAKPGQ